MPGLDRRLMAGLLLTAIFAPAALADDLGAAERAQLLAAPAATPLQRRVADLPTAVRALATPEMADPGRPFQVTDVIGPGASLPGGRLVWGARVGGLYVLHSEFGGVAHGFQVRVYALGPPARLISNTYVRGPFAGFAAWQAQLKAGRQS
ncbi:MAG TPA: hypothetical protein VG939_20110 [Caulobacteraceae bacterium]|nr:hypothetical protein [Caulobacteraceae bacterium]